MRSRGLCLPYLERKLSVKKLGKNLLLVIADRAPRSGDKAQWQRDMCYSFAFPAQQELACMKAACKVKRAYCLRTGITLKDTKKQKVQAPGSRAQAEPPGDQAQVGPCQSTGHHQPVLLDKEPK
ncbi:hypothetical protein CBOM_02734 [Ceraceosorus bombacis]|uniref:Uncharacterized protein n=1 Tax=Ceraceosorus bombacis TaxID=401625 RepID=A0A0P1BFT8_9BASI|nr:hypothetical protein CBOM_02734 [Ceraceosorus bombacis]